MGKQLLDHRPGRATVWQDQKARNADRFQVESSQRRCAVQVLPVAVIRRDQHDRPALLVDP